jgi:hypothetical protein
MLTAKAFSSELPAKIGKERFQTEFPLNYACMCVISIGKVKLTGNLLIVEQGQRPLGEFRLFVDTKEVFVQKFLSLIVFRSTF